MDQQKVVAAIIKKNNKYLIAQRNRKKHLGLKWEFPGGKVLPGEDLEIALKREIKEELDIIIKVNKKIAEESYKDKKINIRLYYFLCTQIDKKIILKEHEEIAWVTKKNFSLYDFAEGDGNVLSKL